VEVHVCNPRYSGSGDRRIWLEANLGQKLETVPENKLKQKGLVCVWRGVMAQVTLSSNPSTDE
jgi:hypothetical protein